MPRVDATHKAENDPVCTPFKRGNSKNYSARRRIPQDLVPVYKRNEIVRSLGTPDPRDARKLAHEFWLELEREFEQKRAALVAAAATPAGPLSELDALVNFCANPESVTRRPVTMTKAESDAQELGEQDAADFDFENEQFIEGYMEELAEEARLARLKEVARKRFLGEGGATPAGNPAPPSGAVPEPFRGGAAAGARQTSFEAVIQKWVAERQAIPKTVERTRKICADFQRVTGITAVEAATKLHVIAFKDWLLTQGKTPANVNVMLPMLGTVFNFAISQALIDVNPVQMVRVADPRRAKEKRLPFSEEALVRIFSGPVYSSGARPVGGAGEAAYWLPILALYTGARLEELGQLAPEDVYQEEDVWVLRITDEGQGQRLKTAGSARRFPLHPDLVELGFTEYAQSQMRAGYSRIFHLLKASADGKETANWSKWFNGRYLRMTCGVADPRYVFHSFRHGFKHYARQALIPEDAHDALTGHASANVARDYGGSDFPLPPLIEAVRKFAIPQKVRSLLLQDG